ncbi:MAG: mevalonate kinase [Polyangia bacterium]
MSTFSAPGKLFLIGEYGVLHGGTAVVAAVDRRATARFVPGGQPSTPLIAAAVQTVAARAARDGRTLPDGAPAVDSAALSQDGQKLGLGSSAAAVVAAVGALWDALGQPLDAATLLPLAVGAHRAAQGGRGSGGDVAASLFGGVIAYARAGEGDPTIRSLSAALPAELVVFRAGDPAATVHFLNAVERLALRDPAEHASRVQPITLAATRFVEAHEAGAGGAMIDAVAAAHEALQALGHAADVPIVTSALETAAALARGCGGAAKGSGAGGGDVGIGFFPDPEAAEAFRARASRLGLQILSITTGARGLSRDV